MTRIGAGRVPERMESVQMACRTATRVTALICAAAVALAAAAPAALYTAVGGTIRNYTVVVADDGTSAAQDYDVAIGRYQLLTQLNANPGNEPLRKAAVTLSRSDLISFQ